MENLCEQYEKPLLFGSLIIVLILGLLYCSYLGDELRFPDERQYTTIAKSIVADLIFSFDGVSPTAFRPPGYPLFMAAILSAGGETFHLRFANFVALAASIWLMHLLLKEHRFRISAAIVPLMFFGYPVLFYTAGTLYPQTLGGTLLVCTLYFLSRNTSISILGAGFSYGTLILTISLFALTLPIIALWPILLKRERRSVVLVSLFIVVTVSLVGAWTYRNYRVFERLVPISTNSGLNLLLGNS